MIHVLFMARLSIVHDLAKYGFQAYALGGGRVLCRPEHVGFFGSGYWSFSQLTNETRSNLEELCERHPQSALNFEALRRKNSSKFFLLKHAGNFYFVKTAPEQFIGGQYRYRSRWAKRELFTSAHWHATHPDNAVEPIGYLKLTENSGLSQFLAFRFEPEFEGFNHFHSGLQSASKDRSPSWLTKRRLQLARLMGESVGAAHAEAIGHGDLAHWNFIIRHDGDFMPTHVKLVDFEFAKMSTPWSGPSLASHSPGFVETLTSDLTRLYVEHSVEHREPTPAETLTFLRAYLRKFKPVNRNGYLKSIAKKILVRSR